MRSLSHLMALSRERELTADEQLAVMQLAKAQRYRIRNASTIKARRAAYERSRRRTKSEVASARARDASGRFVG